MYCHYASFTELYAQLLVGENWTNEVFDANQDWQMPPAWQDEIPMSVCRVDCGAATCTCYRTVTIGVWRR